MNSPDNILIVRTDRIGDVVLTMPLARIIKKQYPECRISFLLRDYTSALVQNHPYIDNVLVLNESDGKINKLEVVKQLRKYNFSHCLVVYPTFIISLIMFLSGIRNRIGTGYRWYSVLFNKRIYKHRKYGREHELVHNVNMLEHIGIKEQALKGEVNFDINIVPETLSKVNYELKLAGIPIDNGFIIIHPGSGGSAIDLPLKKFKKLAGLLADNLPLTIILTGSIEEKDICQEIVVSNKIYNLAGKFDLRELIALISISRLLIANSTGPIHIAAALDLNTIGFYPKIKSCSATRWGPFSNKSRIYNPEIDCSDCTRKQCEALNCMDSIDINKVFTDIKTIVDLDNK